MTTHKWNDIKKRHHSDKKIEALEQEARQELEFEELVAGSLKEVRLLAQKTQVDVAKSQDVTQPHISRLESRPINSMMLETLQRYIEALGGSLEIRVKLDEHEVLLEPDDLVV